MTKKDKISLGIAVGLAATAWFLERRLTKSVSGVGSLLSKKDYNDFRTYWEDERDWRIKDWYRKAYPTDDLGGDLNGELTFNQLYILMKYGVPFYELVGASDSIVRERIFHKLCEIYNKPYDYFYELWLNS